MGCSLLVAGTSGEKLTPVEEPTSADVKIKSDSLISFSISISLPPLPVLLLLIPPPCVLGQVGVFGRITLRHRCFQFQLKTGSAPSSESFYLPEIIMK